MYSTIKYEVEDHIKTLTLLMDIRIASSTAKMGFVFMSRGMV